MSADKLDFNELHDEVTSKLKKIEAIDDISTRKQQTLELKAQIETVSHILPSYQQLSYSEKIKSLLESEPIAPRRRFKFSEKAMEARKNRQVTQRVPRVFQEDVIEPSVTCKLSTVCHLSDRNPLVTDIKNCIIITSQECSTATFKQITNCAIIADSQGPVFINNSHNCIFFIQCHQLRIHESSNLKIHAQIPSGRGIIEHCKDMVFDGIDIDDFDHPNGGSVNFTLKAFPDDLMAIRQDIKENPGDVLKRLDEVLRLSV